MDAAVLHSLATLLRTQRIASLGTLRDGSPLVTMALYALAPDFSAFYLHLSRLAPHTQALLKDPRVGLMITEGDDGSKDPQTLARVSIQSDVLLISKSSIDYEVVKPLYLARFPDAATMFTLGDFDLYRIAPEAARFVAGFAQAYNLTAGHFREAAKLA